MALRYISISHGSKQTKNSAASHFRTFRIDNPITNLFPFQMTLTEERKNGYGTGKKK